MEKIRKSIDFSIILLSFTNIWVFLYINLVEYLNFKFPASVKEIYYRPEGVFPEPFEIPLYLGLAVLFVFILRLTYSRLVLFLESLKKFPLIKPTLFVILLLLFLSKLGDFPLIGDMHPFVSSSGNFLHLITLGIYLLGVGVVLIESHLIQRFVTSRKLMLLVFTGIFIVIAVLILEPNFPITPHNYAFFYGPALEVAQGKTIYTDIPSQYGFLSILVLASFLKVGVDLLSYLPILIWVLSTMMYFVCFYLIFRVSKSLSFSLLGLFSILTVHYFSYIQSPQAGALRWLPVVIILLLFLWQKKMYSKKFIFFLSLLSLWFIDSGIVILFTYSLTLLFLFLSKKVDLFQAVKAFLFLVFFLIALVASISVIHLIARMKPIYFLDIFYSLKKHASSGVVMIPIDAYSYFWLVMLIYLASIIYFFRKTEKNDSKGNEDTRFERLGAESDVTSDGNGLPLSEKRRIELPYQLLLFSANATLFSSAYFVGRSAPDYLFKISLFPLLTLFLVIAPVYKQLANRTKILVFFIIFFFLIVVPAFGRKEFFAETLLARYKSFKTGGYFPSLLKEALRKKHEREILLIEKSFQKENEIAIVSADETYVFFLVNKKNLIDSNPQVGINTKTEMDKALQRIGHICPEKIVADCTLFNRCPEYESFTQGWPQTFPIILKEIETRCRVSYKATECTDQLCVAQKTK